VAPIHVATTFERGPGIEYPRGYIYSRISNPGRSLFEVTMAKVEGGVSAAAFGSGKRSIRAHSRRHRRVWMGSACFP
jgi:cystathionine gamma-synthase